MAKINNQDVIQKLIDELKLYPGKDIIPTELAEKILPVFQINKENVNVTIQNPVADIVEDFVEAGASGGGTIFTTSATGKTYITSVCISGVVVGTVDGGTPARIEVTVDGTTRILCSIYMKGAGTPSVIATQNQTFPNPILLDANTLVRYLTGHVSVKGSATVVGYLVP